jgi:hypothetical protein
MHDEDVLMAYEASRSQVQYAKQILYYKRVGEKFMARNDSPAADKPFLHLTEDEYESLSCMLEGVIFMLCISEDDNPLTCDGNPINRTNL